MKLLAIPGLVLGLSFPALTAAQEKGTTVQQAGDCSVNITGNNNTTASLVCNGIDPKLAEQVRAILNGTRRNENAVKEMSEKLDRIIRQMDASKKVLTSEEQKAFTALLKDGNVIPESTQFACPETNEGACVYAAGFIPLFQRAGWQIEGPTIGGCKPKPPKIPSA
jgi:hypothetical protein